MKNKKIFLLFSFVLLVSFLFFAKATLASDNLGINAVDNTIILNATDPRTIIVRVINIFLGLLGAIALALVVWGGFMWMTSEGNEEKISKAKGLLKNAVIGLAIILASWGIVYFLFKNLFPANQAGTGNNTPGQVFFQAGLGAIGVCSLESVYPAPRQTAVPRNTMIMITFREEVSSSSISNENVIICNENDFDAVAKKCSSPVSFVSSTVDNKIFTLLPDVYLGNENSFSNYIVYLSNDILIADGSRSVFDECSSQYFVWNFEVSNILDLTPPQVASIFPYPDNEQDTETVSNLSYAQATMSITGTERPKVAADADVVSTVRLGATTFPIQATIDRNYNDVYDEFDVTINSDRNTAQMIAKIDGGGSRTFNLTIGSSYMITGYDPLVIELFNPNYPAGASWRIRVSRKVMPDKIVVGSKTYWFGLTVNTGTGATLAQNIVNALSTNPNVEATRDPNSLNISLRAKMAGSSGNGLPLSTTATSTITTTSFTGGADLINTVNINDKKDKPMNSIIQINFNEAINPLTVVGDSAEVSSTIRVINLSDNNNVIPGSFSISSDYRTLEFKSANLCGVNACGEDIYCLPANSKLKVEVVAASLFNCSGNNNNCANKSPFSTCTNNICTNSADNKFYPLANISLGSGVMDAAANSMDGNANSSAEGPVNYFDKNVPNTSYGDNLRWSFWTNNKIESNPPQINSIFPDINATSSDLWLPVKIGFNKLMMASTLRTGEIAVDNGRGPISHRLLNLISGQLVGYWIGAENIDENPFDGEPEKTNAYINHAQFYEGADYASQIGSGVKDIYQNCFKPSVGLDCEATNNMPYCCNGVATSSPCN